MPLKERLEIAPSNPLDPADNDDPQPVVVLPDPKGCPSDFAGLADLSERQQLIGGAAICWHSLATAVGGC